jgi:hypothetical protein
MGVEFPLPKYDPKRVHLAEVSPYFRRTASVLHAGEFFWRIKRFECENFRFEVPCRRIDDRKSFAFIMPSCILVPSSTKSRKILVQQKGGIKGEHTLSNRQVNFILKFIFYDMFLP